MEIGNKRGTDVHDIRAELNDITQGGPNVQVHAIVTSGRIGRRTGLIYNVNYMGEEIYVYCIGGGGCCP